MKIKKVISLILIVLLIFLNINTIRDVYAENNANSEEKQTNIVRIADKSTVDSYKEINTDGRYDGRVWTDKSVYSADESSNVTLDNRFNISYDDDFLTVFSALSSSQYIKSPKLLDIMFVVDISGTMGNVESKPATEIEKTPIYKTVEAINSAVNQMLSLNSKTRIGIAVYGTTSALLLPLGNYSIVEETDFLKVEKIEAYGPTQGLHFKLTATAMDNDKKQQVVKYADNAGSSSYDYHKNETQLVENSGNYVLKGTSGHTEGTGTKEDPYHVGHITNQQAGLARGLKALADTEKTVLEPISGVYYSYIPCMIHLTDGQASDISIIDATHNWNNVDMDTDIAYTSKLIGSNKYNSYQLSGDSAAIPMIYQTLMTASYYTSMVNKHYQENARKAGIENSKDITITNYSIYASDNAPLDSMQEGTNKTIIQTINNPSKFFTPSNENKIITGNDDGAEDGIGAYTLFEQWKNGETVNETYTVVKKDNKQFDIKLNSSKEQLADDKYGITENDIIQNINYVESDNFLSTGFENIDSVIEKILQEEKDIIATPIDSVADEVNTINTLSYVDPVGKYMEIKHVLKLLLFGQQYDIIEDGDPVEENNTTRQNYKAVSENNEDLQISNLSYGDDAKFNLSDIKIWKETTKNDNNEESTNSEELLHIDIPKNALPIKLDKIKLDKSGDMLNYETNVDTDNALPIRVVYTVGVSDEILKENEIDLTKVSQEYVEKNTKKEEKKSSLYFYSNYYSKNIHSAGSTKTEGDAYTVFVPSVKNRFYNFQKNLTIYKNSTGGDSNGEGILSETGGSVALSDPVKSLEEIDKNETYYFAIDYYAPSEDGSTGKLVKYALSRKGEDFYGVNGECYLTYFDTVTKTEVQEKGENAVVATKIGGIRMGNLRNLTIDKEENKTDTADLCYAPKFTNTNENNNCIITYLGNNGRLAVETPIEEEPPKEEPPQEEPPKEENPPKGELPKDDNLSKDEPKTPDNTVVKGTLPQTGEKSKLIVPTIILDFVCVGMFFCRKYRKFKDVL